MGVSFQCYMNASSLEDTCNVVALPFSQVVSDEEESFGDVAEKPPKALDAGRPGGLPPLHPLKH